MLQTNADLRLAKITKSFGPLRAVDDVSISLGRGEFYSLLGPSGCGKTTTLRLVAGFERPDEGRIELAGDDITTLPPDKRKVNTVFQHYALFPHMTVEENVAYGLSKKHLTKTEIADRLARGISTVRLAELRDRYPRQLSGGQQQRVALARALVNEPTVLLLDEPLAALDLKLRKAMQTELKKLQERVGITFLYVTHDQEEALTLSDRIAVMSDGRVLQEGSPNEIYERPRSKFVADFIGETNFFKGVVQEVGNTVTVRTEDGHLLRCARADFAQPGSHVAVSVRPERIGAATGNASDANEIDGLVVRSAYFGDLVQYHVRMASGRELVVQRQNDRAADRSAWAIGENVRLAWDADSALVVEDDAAHLADEESRHLVELEADG